MEDKQKEEMYDYAFNLLFQKKMSVDEVAKVLVDEKEMDSNEAMMVATMLDHEINGARKEQANNDMLYGALWCIGGIVATMADIGYIFWGAIVFGGIQFLRGLSNA